MSEKKEKKIKEDDPKQSEAFRKAVYDLEAAGDLNGVEAEKAFEALLQSGAKPLQKKD